MNEQRHPANPQVALPAFVLGAALALLPMVVSHPAALLSLWLAQAPLALAAGSLMAWRPQRESWARRGGDLLAVALLYALPYLAAVVAIAWPLKMFVAYPGVESLLVLCSVAGLLLLALWNTWPSFARAAQSGGGLRALVAASRDDNDGADTGDALGLVAAVALLAVVMMGLLLAWPEPLFAESLRTPLLLGHVALASAVQMLLALPGWATREPASAGDAVAMQRAARVEPVLAPAPEEPAANEPDEAELGAPPDAQTLYAAVRDGDCEQALMSIAAGADVRALPGDDARDQRTLAMLAALLPDLRVLRALLEHGIDINHAHAGLSPLLAATRDSWQGRLDAVGMLLANGADAGFSDGDGNTPLHHAARSSDPGVVAALLDAGAALDAVNHDGLSPLAMACAVANWRVARLLLERGAAPAPVAGQPALLAASAGDDDAAGVGLLLRHKAKVDARDAQQRSALMLACQAGNPEIVEALLVAGADCNARDATGMTPLLEAASNGNIAVLQQLAEQPGLDVLVGDAQGRNALAMACLSSSNAPEVLSLLLAIGVDREQCDQQGKRPIEHAMSAGRWRLVAVLEPEQELPASIQTDAMAAVSDERTPAEWLRHALGAGDFAQAQALLDLAAPEPAVRDALLLECIDDANREVVSWLLAHGAQGDRAHAGQDSVLFSLLDRGEAGAPGLRRLLDHAISPAGAGGLARYLSACVAGVDDPDRGERLALELLARGADPFAPDMQGTPSACLAARLDWPLLLDRLLASGVDAGRRDAHGLTALHLACTVGSDLSVRVLVRHGAAVNARAPDGQTAQGIALANGHHDLVRWLEWPLWPLPNRALRPSDVPSAAMTGDLLAIERLLALGMPIDAQDAQGCTALLRAAGGGQRAIVERLLAAGADPSLAANTGATPLSAAVSMRQADIVECLLAGGAQVDQPLPGGVTPMMVACALGLTELVKRLLARRARIGAFDDQGHAPLHYAAQFLFQCRDRQRALDLLDTLLVSGAAPDQVSDSGHTPLLLLLGARADTGAQCDETVILAALDRLLAERVALDSREGRGFAPLHLAALHGLASVVRRLLQAGASPEVRDGLNRKAQEVAVLRGFVDVAAEFEPARAGASMARFLRNPDPG
jgi:ankyrin repeat protein